MKTPTVDRRTEPRQPAHDEVRMRPAGTLAAPFVGRLIDLSAFGFRAEHPCLTLGSGDQVEFEFGGRTGTARAVWTRIMGRRAESGFSILGAGK